MPITSSLSQSSTSLNLEEERINKTDGRDQDCTRDLSFIEPCIDSPKNTTSGFNYEGSGLARAIVVSESPTTESILSSARHSGQLGTTNSSYATPSSTTYPISAIDDPLPIVHTYIAIGVRSRLLSHPFKFIRELLPPRIRLREHTLELVSPNRVSTLTVYPLSTCQPSIIVDRRQRTNRVPCSSRIWFPIFEASQNGRRALACSPSTFWVISRLNIEPWMPAAMAVCDVLGIASRTGGYPR